MDITCPYSKHLKQGMLEDKICTITNQHCLCSRRCINQNTIVHTQNALSCIIRLKEESKDK